MATQVPGREVEAHPAYARNGSQARHHLQDRGSRSYLRDKMAHKNEQQSVVGIEAMKALLYFKATIFAK